MSPRKWVNDKQSGERSCQNGSASKIGEKCIEQLINGYLERKFMINIIGQLSVTLIGSQGH